MAGQEPEQDEQEIAEEQKPWSTRAQLIAAVLWPSFLAACVATMLFFAVVDPGLIHNGAAADIRQVRLSGYGMGFFFFWLVSGIASAMSVYLVRTSHIPANDEPDDHEPNDRKDGSQ